MDAATSHYALSHNNMKRTPIVYSASEIATWPTSEEFHPNLWRPARPCPITGLRLKMRLRIAWWVFIGKYDALSWGVLSGEWKNNQVNYRDLTEKGFIRAGKEAQPNGMDS